MISIYDFPRDASKKDGRSIYCHNCHKKINKARRSKPDYNVQRQKRRNDKEANRAWRLRTRYGITVEQFDEMFKSQGSCCYLCKAEKSDKKSFVIDHCHKTGKIRGILCSYCNRALGMFKDNPEILKKAIAYLEKK